MQLFYHFGKKDPQKIVEGVKKAYGVKNPGKINGFAGAFLADHKDVYVTDEIAKVAETHKSFQKFLDDCITRFYHDDWGFVTRDEAQNNVEIRYLGGSTNWMIARYGCNDPHVGVVFANLYDITLISFIEEDVAEIYEDQYRKHPYPKRTINEIFLNELKYERTGQKP